MGVVGGRGVWKNCHAQFVPCSMHVKGLVEIRKRSGQLAFGYRLHLPAISALTFMHFAASDERKGEERRTCHIKCGGPE